LANSSCSVSAEAVIPTSAVTSNNSNPVPY
jgi:hypothetical protein